MHYEETKEEIKNDAKNIDQSNPKKLKPNHPSSSNKPKDLEQKTKELYDSANKNQTPYKIKENYLKIKYTKCLDAIKEEDEESSELIVPILDEDINEAQMKAMLDGVNNKYQDLQLNQIQTVYSLQKAFPLNDKISDALKNIKNIEKPEYKEIVKKASKNFPSCPYLYKNGSIYSCADILKNSSPLTAIEKEIVTCADWTKTNLPIDETFAPAYYNQIINASDEDLIKALESLGMNDFSS